MHKSIKINKKDWQKLLIHFGGAGENVYAPVRHNGVFDYELINDDNVNNIVNNAAKPASPLKIFFLPLRLNVTGAGKATGRNIIIGAPACDIEGLKLLDAIYLDNDYTDETYQTRRQSSIIIGAPCHQAAENCHCTVYGLNPWPEEGCDLSMASADDYVILDILSDKGEAFIGEINSVVATEEAGPADREGFRDLQKKIAAELTEKNNGLPGTKDTGVLTARADKDFWKEHSSNCVSCGACSAICPTCTCFLLIDRPGFEKIKQQDTCQYPAFQRVAGGEDPLKELSMRFRNRYMCKYVWKPENYDVLACTGCGRCTDACIAGISKNEVINHMR